MANVTDAQLGRALRVIAEAMMAKPDDFNWYAKSMVETAAMLKRGEFRPSAPTQIKVSIEPAGQVDGLVEQLLEMVFHIPVAIVSQPFELYVTVDDLFANLQVPAAIRRRFSTRVEQADSEHPVFLIEFNGHGLEGVATKRVVLAVYPAAHPEAQRLRPDAATKHVVVYDSHRQLDVAEDVVSVEQLGKIACKHWAA